MAPLDNARALDVVESVFRDLEWEAVRSDGESAIEAAFADSPIALAAAFAFEDEHRFVFFLYLATPVSPSRFAEMLEFIARANYGLVVGNWEISMETGEIRFRVGVDHTPNPLSQNLVVNAIRSAMKVADAYQEALQNVLEGRQTAREAIAAVETTEGGHK